MAAPVSVDSATLYAAAETSAYMATGTNPTRFLMPSAGNTGDTIHISAAGPGGWAARTGDLNLWAPRAVIRKLAICGLLCGDGSKLVAVGGGQIYTSSDFGMTWTARENTRNWWLWPPQLTAPNSWRWFNLVKFSPSRCQDGPGE